MPATARSIRPLSPALERPFEALGGRGEELARSWIRRVLDRASLAEIEGMATGGIVRDLADMLNVLLFALSREAAGGTRARHRESARPIARIAAFRGHEDPTARSLATDVADLHWIVVEALHAEAEDLGRTALLEGLERVALVFADVHAAGAEELLAVRSRELERLANTDPLTGLHNRRHLQAQLEHLLEVNRRYGHPFSVILFDLVGLKRLNDAQGHAAGDRALIGVATAAAETVRSVDTVVRLSGDEFCVLAPSQGAPLAGGLAARLVEAVATLSAPGAEPIAISAGVAGCPAHGIDAAELLDAADAAMYRARREGASVGFARSARAPGQVSGAGSSLS